MTCPIFPLICGILAFLTLPAAAPAQQRSPVEDRVAAILDAHADRPEKAQGELDALLETMIVHAPLKDRGWTEVAVWRRLLRVVAAAEAAQRPELLRALRGAPSFARALAMVMREEDQPEKVAALAARLARERGAHLEKYATLAAAVCVVHDEPLEHRVNENRAAAGDPVEIFDFFRASEGASLMGIRAMPAELLVYVVDTTAPIEEMKWAQGKYRGDRRIGQRYFDVRYDEDHFYKEAPKKLTLAGFGFRNILTHGGVCIDQAYFAAHAGKSIGVPTAMVVGHDSEGSHAWVGYLEARGKQVRWNFDTGRYDSYEAVRGMLLNPQTRRWVSDARLAVAAQAMTDSAEDRMRAIALADAAALVAQRRASKRPLAGEPDSAVPPAAKPRDASARTQLELLEAAVRTTPASLAAWDELREMAKAGDLSLTDLKEWSETLFQLCGRSYPEFSLEVLMPMIASVKSTREQDALWNNAFKRYAQHPDLAAQIRLRQGRMWEDAGDPAKAWACYQDVIAKYPNTSSSAVDAAVCCRRLLEKTGKTEALAPMLGAAWRKTQRPGRAGPSFTMQSNWFRLGKAYADALEAEGKTGEARKVRSTLGLR